MVGRNERPRLALALALALLLVGASALLAAGCGSDAGAEETTTTLAAAPAEASPTDDSAVTQIHYEELVGSYVRLTEETPPEFVQAVEGSRPVVVLFYVTGSEDDGRVREVVSDLQADYPEVAFLTYAHDQPDAYGDLAGQLRIDYPPQMVFIKAGGLINDVLSGFADRGTVNQSVSNLI